jgi:hypothetical protein
MNTLCLYPEVDRSQKRIFYLLAKTAIAKGAIGRCY